ncbi:hypothetical protein F444_07193 [Phytophthora nicotianae P1976]|uniref:Uncharacterized protein n=3 Tax=Phytophthora nicotianae TaxID=4792 RepID=A0A081AFI0_PHYNI|nr:hypothetical protein F444_07193 [Phytophthora nicotianae P1976]
MHKVLRHDDVVEGMKFIIQSQPIVTRPFFQIDTSEPILAELSSNLAWMQLQTGSIVPILGENPSVTFSTQGKNNERDETRIEITATTPLACTVREAEPILWHYLTNEDTSNSFGFYVHETNTRQGWYTSCVIKVKMVQLAEVRSSHIRGNNEKVEHFTKRGVDN